MNRLEDCDKRVCGGDSLEMAVRYQQKKNNTQEEKYAKGLERLGEKDTSQFSFSLKQADRYLRGIHYQMVFMYTSTFKL